MTIPDAAAHIDPWLVLSDRRGHDDRSPCALFLFGFALHHHVVAEQRRQPHIGPRAASQDHHRQ